MSANLVEIGVLQQAGNAAIARGLTFRAASPGLVSRVRIRSVPITGRQSGRYARLYGLGRSADLALLGGSAIAAGLSAPARNGEGLIWVLNWLPGNGLEPSTGRETTVCSTN